MSIFTKKSAWALLSVYMCLWLVIVMVAGGILDGYKNVINATLGLTGYRTETIVTEGEDLEYFKSNFVQRDEDGNVIYTTDEDGYVHELYDDVALRAAALEKANQVQREGTTILWNSDKNGLPLSEGDKVSLFSHSTVDWVYSGGGSGGARTSGASDMKKALTNAGLSVNNTLWDFYKSGAGKDYIRTDRFTINEVPWSKYTDAVNNSFASYGDAAIIVLSRKAGEGSVAQGGAFDVTQTEADTPSGDYYDMSAQERKMIEEVVALKKAGVFKKVVVLLNTATDMWLAPLMAFKNDIDCCMWVGQTGYQGLNEVGNILVGKSIPSGHLVDTFLYNTQSNPVFANSVASMYSNAKSFELMNLGYQAMYVTYAEGIYVGYKYYETRYEDAVIGRGNATSTAGAVNSTSNWVYSEEVAFPFGYGASYTTFEYSNYDVTVNEDGDYQVTLTVKNTGSAKGADAVQIYVQKPYTSYDRMWGIEEASVNLAGYAKTKRLNPGESVDVTIIVRADAFKTYDANNKKTYIREKSEGIDAYYITAAQNAHEAVNNILAAKGYSPANTNGVMDAEGNTNLVKRYDFDKDDFETFSTSEVTGNPITNRFDNADWNKYEGKTEDNVTYLSRNNWQATYPTTTTKLTMNQTIADETRWNQPITANPDDKSPTFGAAHLFNLIDMRGLDFDDPLWNDLLNQLTIDEMITFLGSGYHGMKDISSIAKPADVTKDGPLGVRMKYLTNSSEYTLSYPSTVILAASYNDKLAEEVGELMGEDMMHAGVTGIYAPGANIHRSTYSGRNYEYYSEDGFISGMMVKAQVTGIQSKGCYVVIKHIVLNDQETNRHGINTWVNEQAIREIYLPAFEYITTEGTCTGMMSGFNRVGTKWSGAHKGLLTDVLRGEWGYEGFVISDCAWREFMDVEDGLLAGNDCVLDTIDPSNYSQVKGNATLENAIREATHRVLYVVANSNAMNGFSSNTKVYEVKEWWQLLVEDIQKGVMIATAIVILITIAIFIISGAHGGFSYGGHGVPTIIICFIVSIAILVGSVVGPIVLADGPLDLSGLLGGDTGDGTEDDGTTDETPDGGSDDGENPDDGTGEGEGGGEEVDPPKQPSLKDELGDNLTDYYFEAECAEIVAANAAVGKGVEAGKTLSEVNNPSGGGYVYNLSKAGDATITFKVNASADGKAVLSLRMGLTTVERKLSDLFMITVNGKEISYSADLTFGIYEKVKYFDWTELEVAIIDLKAGDNVIELTKTSKGMNFDRITLTSAQTLMDSREVGVGHTYGEWELLDAPTVEKAGKACSYCLTCRNFKTEEIPAISEANGYKKTVKTAATETTFGEASWTYTIGESNFNFDTLLYPDGAKSFVFEAEKSEFTGDAKRYNDATCDASGNAYLGKLAGSTWTVTFNVQSDKNCQALLLVRVGRRNDRSVSMTDGKILTVNGTEVEIPDSVIFPQIESESKYLNWEEFEVVVVDLVVGNNVITLSNNKKAFTNIDYFRFVTAGELSWYVEE